MSAIMGRDLRNLTWSDMTDAEQQEAWDLYLRDHQEGKVEERYPWAAQWAELSGPPAAEDLTEEEFQTQEKEFWATDGPGISLEESPAREQAYWAEYEARQAALLEESRRVVGEWLEIAEVRQVATTNEWRILTADQVRTLPPPNFLTDKYLVAGELNMLSGPSMSYKSFLALHWAARLHQEGKKVLYCANEGARDQADRLQTWADFHAADGMGSLPMFIGSYDIVVHRHNLIQMVGEADLIVIDTLRRATPGQSEDSSDDMTQVIAACDEIKSATGAAILLIDHTGHENTTRPRGSSVKLDAVYMGMSLKRDGKVPVTTLTNWKLKGAQEWSSERWQLLELGDRQAVLVPQHTVPIHQAELQKRDRRHRDVLREELGGQEFTKDEAAKVWECHPKEANKRLQAGQGVWVEQTAPGGSHKPAKWRLLAAD